MSEEFDRELIECAMCSAVLNDKPLWIIAEDCPKTICEDCYSTYYKDFSARIQK